MVQTQRQFIYLSLIEPRLVTVPLVEGLHLHPILFGMYSYSVWIACSRERKESRQIKRRI
jgi:hypothetical protein